ncbi:MAG: DNA repair protein RecN [Alphaproteobacteria bacterium]|nr:DNA repair protein RecN [Alphaproteobacteria bacterium]
MLSSLSINNVVLIERLVITFHEGLCVLTGETGAGKSVLLDALGLALGVRAESGLVRNGADYASVTASFQIHEGHPSCEILKEADIILDEDILLLRRVVYNNGKSRAFINDQPVTVGLLKEVGSTLVEIHGQFETQGLLNPATHRAMLDEYAGFESDLKERWNTWKEVLSEQQRLTEETVRSKVEELYWRDSLNDLENLSPQENEEERLSQMREMLRNKEDVINALAEADALLNDDNDPVRKAWAVLDKISDKAGERLKGAVDALSRASDEMREAAIIVQEFSTEFQDSDYSLEEIEERLFALRAQARKHHCHVNDLPKIQQELKEKLESIEKADENSEARKEELAVLKKAYIEEAQRVSKLRSDTAQRLNKLVQKELSPLKLDKAKFITQITPLPESEWGTEGIDKVRFLVSTNPGQELGPIHKIASGGEMSRFMLALKVVIAREGSTHSFIFDEVDTGIGGSTADAVGERLARLAKAKQVLVVTHAPQIAARADYHWIVKKSGKQENITTITALETRAQRCEEIARMLAGAEITNEARAAANKLLETGT